MKRNKRNPFDFDLLEKVVSSNAAHNRMLNKALRTFPFKFREKESGYRCPSIEDKYPEVSMKPL